MTAMGIQHVKNLCQFFIVYYRTNTAIAVFYSVLGGLSGCCFVKTAPHYSAEQ